MLKIFKLLSVSTVLGFGALTFAAGGASAMTPISSATSGPAAVEGNANIQMAQMNSNRNDRRMRTSWSRNRDGNRCTRRNGNCRYFRNGYYYENAWWTLPLIIGGTIGALNYSDDGGYGSRHVEWCSDRYRSYNPRNNTWVAYSGNVNQCNSPY